MLRAVSLAGVASSGVPAADAGGSLNCGVGISLPLGVPASKRPKLGGAGVCPAFFVLGFGVPFAAAPAAGVSAVLLSAQVTDFLPVLPPVLGAAALSWPLPPAAAAPTGVPNMVSATGVATSRCLLIWPSATHKKKRRPCQLL
jgi:hypothetical protein